MNGRWRKTRPALVALLGAMFCAFVSCTCGGGEAGGGADGGGVPAGDDDGDDDFVGDDDVTDDDAGTTTTTSPTTTTSTSSPTTTTTTVATTTTTTTSTMNPGTGTACDPFNKIPTVIDREKPYGPWPEFEERGITFRQIIASGAGQGQNDVLVTDDGLVRVAAQDGRSLDVIAVGPAGEVSREVVDPRGGEWKVLGKDADENLYLLYTVHVDQSPETWEVRAATNKSGEWERELLFTSNDDGNLSLDMEVSADGLMHFVFCGRDDSAVAWYATWDGATYTETQLAASPGSWRYAYAMALDSAGMPHALLSESTGVWHWRIEDGVWTGNLASGNAFAWDLVIDANDVMHAGLAANGGHLVYGRFESGAWTFEDLDDCQDGVSFINVEVDADGKVHVAYTDGDQDDVLYATNASGAWVHTFLYEEVIGSDFGHALDMASALDANGKIHIVHRRFNEYTNARDSDLNLTTNASGEWVRKRVIKGSGLNFAPGAIDAENRIHLVFTRDLGDRLVYGVLDGDSWEEETIEAIADIGTIDGTTIAIELSPFGFPSLLYATATGEDYEIDQMKFATRDARGWHVETIADDAEGYAFGNLAFDSTGRPHVTFSEVETELAPYEAVYGLMDDRWNIEKIDGVRRAYSLGTDPDDRAVIGYEIQFETTEETRIGRRVGFENWEADVVVTSDGQAGGAKILIRDDGVVDLYAGISDDSIIPDGIFYATDASGDWQIESLQIAGTIPGFVRDEDDFIHLALDAGRGDPPPDPTGLYYLTNSTGSWQRHFVESWIRSPEPVSIHLMSDGRLKVLFDHHSVALMSATFEPGME